MKKKLLASLLLFFTLACAFIWPIHPTAPTLPPLPPASPTATLIVLPPPPTPSYSVIGVIGRYIPQRIRMYVFEHNGDYITGPLYALGLNATEGDVSQIKSIFFEEERTFDNLVAV